MFRYRLRMHPVSPPDQPDPACQQAVYFLTRQVFYVNFYQRHTHDTPGGILEGRPEALFNMATSTDTFNAIPPGVAMV